MPGERSLAVVNSHYPVKSSSSALTRNNYNIPIGCQGYKSNTSCKDL